MIKCPVCVSLYAFIGACAQMGALRTFVEGELERVLVPALPTGCYCVRGASIFYGSLLKFHRFNALKIKTMKILQTAKRFQYPLPDESCQFNFRHSLLSHNIILSPTICNQTFFKVHLLDTVIPPGVSALPYHHPPPIKKQVLC